MAKGKGPQYRYTVLFYVDGDHAVETFAEHVTGSYADAFDKAVAKVKRGGGHMCSAREFANATEIVTYSGHLEGARA